jgi:single-stranded-DNA-specific exonuclease
MSVFCNEISARNRRWEVRPAPETLPEVTLRNGEKVPREVVEIAVRRGVEDVAAFLEPSLRAFMPDPSTMTGMDDAVARFVQAIEQRERIAVFGDYDVDGATSTAVLIRYLRMVGVDDSIFYIPQRLTEGYGPNSPAMDKLHAQGTRLVVIVDSGTTAFEPIQRAVDLGMEVIVIDHHEPKETGELPPAHVVNPKRVEEDGSLAHLCTAGLALMFLVGVNRKLRNDGYFARTGVSEPVLSDLLGIVALGTVADVVPLRTLNRAFVALGLRQMGKIAGIRALVEATGQDEFSARTCGFVFGPCINAGGRISDTMQGARLLITDDEDEAREIATRLFELNRERQQMQKEMVADCIRSVEESNSDDAVIVAFNQNWHPGVVGLGASKVKDHFDRSAVVIGQDGKGSGRSVDGFNIGKAFIKAVEAGLLKKGGGHAAAGGLTIDPALLPEFRAFMNEQAKGLERPPTKVDIALPVGGLTQRGVEAFELLAPFGMGNAKPRIAFTGGVLDEVRILKGTHVKGRISSMDGSASIDFILFGGVGTPLGDALIGAEGRFVDIMGEAGLNTYGGVTKIQVRPDDAMIGAPAAVFAAAAE